MQGEATLAIGILQVLRTNGDQLALLQKRIRNDRDRRSFRNSSAEEDILKNLVNVTTRDAGPANPLSTFSPLDLPNQVAHNAQNGID